MGDVTSEDIREHRVLGIRQHLCPCSARRGLDRAGNKVDDMARDGAALAPSRAHCHPVPSDLQKRPAVVAMVLVFASVIFHAQRHGARTSGRRIALATALTGTLYFALVVIPVYSENSRSVEDVLEEPGSSRSESGSSARRTAQRLVD